MADATLRGLVLAPYGRDAELLSDALAECGARPVVCRDLDGLLLGLRSDSPDLLVISDDAFVGGGDDRLLAALRGRTPDGDDILPLVLPRSSPKSYSMGFSFATIAARCGSRKGGSTTFSPSVAGSSSTAKPGPSVAISNRIPFGSRKYRLRK